MQIYSIKYEIQEFQIFFAYKKSLAIFSIILNLDSPGFT